MQLNRLSKLTTGLVALALFGVCFQAPIAVFADTSFSSFALIIKSWKEILFGVAAIILIFIIWQKKLQYELYTDKLLWVCLAVAALNVFLLAILPNNQLSEVASLIINLRIYLAFIVCYILVKIYPPAKKILLKSIGAGIALVCIIALLQATILPKDILKSLGYSDLTIKPYLTVDQNNNFVRINSTLRGPNPLGAFAVIAISLMVVFWRRYQKISKPCLILGIVVLCGALVALWFSYSRGAWLAMLVSIIIIPLIYQAKNGTTNRHLLLIVPIVTVILITLIGLNSKSSFVQNVIFHNNPESSSVIKSNHGHMQSMTDGVSTVVNHPFGFGLGSVGSPSLLSGSPKIIENQYIYMAIETGVLGLVLQMMVFGIVLWKLYSHRDNLSIGVLVSGIGMAIIGMFLPVWADDTIGIIWWSLAGLTIATNKKKNNKKELANA